MVILHIACIGDDHFNGVNVVVPQYLQEQANLGHQVALYNVNGKIIPGIQNQLSNGKFDILRFPEPFCHPDIVVFQECYRIEYILISKQLKKLKIPYIVIPHGELGQEAQQKKYFKKKLANLLIFNQFIDDAAGVQCLSEREYNSTLFGNHKFIATNGVSIPTNFKIDFNCQRTKMVYIGRLDIYHKGLDILIEAISMIHNEMIRKKVEIDIYGPDYKGRFANLSQMILDAGVEDVVKLHHEVYGEEKENILINSDIFIQTSRFEGMPLGILEALSYGLPCLVSKGTTLGEMISSANAGWMAENDPESVANTIMLALEDVDLFKELGFNARDFACSRFSWKCIEEETIAIYSDLI